MYIYCLNNPIVYYDLFGKKCNCIYDGTAADFKRLEYGLPPIKCTHNINITAKLDKYLKKDAGILIEYARKHNPVDTLLFFLDKVKYGGEWDFKSQSDWGLKPENTYYYNGLELRYDDIGNIHYGYVGSVILGKQVLLVGAGVAQMSNDIKNGRLPQFSHFWCNYDDPRDQAMVLYGAILWDIRRSYD